MQDVMGRPVNVGSTVLYASTKGHVTAVVAAVEGDKLVLDKGDGKTTSVKAAPEKFYVLS